MSKKKRCDDCGKYYAREASDIISDMWHSCNNDSLINIPYLCIKCAKAYRDLYIEICADFDAMEYD